MNTVDVFVQVAVEGTVDKAVALKLIQHVGAQADTVYVAYGKQRLLEKVSGYNQAAKGQPWLVLVDLDRCSCAVALLQKWVPQLSPYLCMRVAVRMVEAWLLADATNIADFLGVPVIPIAKPKFTKKTAVDDPLLKVPPACRGNRAGAPLAVPLAKREGTGQYIGG